MTHERDLERDRHRTPSQPSRGAEIPGRRSASAALAGPTRPVTSGILLRKGRGDVAADAEAAVARSVGSGGHELPADLRRRFESSLGTDLSGVRIHTGADSQGAAEAVGARAYATGNDIHFAARQYDPQSPEGQQLIAHEVAHTVQQRGGSPVRQHKLAVSSEGDAFEVEADRAASAMVAGTPFALGNAPAVVARKEETNGDAKDEPEKKQLPSISGTGVHIPIGNGKLGNVDLDWREGSYSRKVETDNEPLFKIEESHQQPIATGLVLDTAFDVGVSLKANASASVSGKLEPAPGPRVVDEDELVLTVSGGGQLVATAEGGIKLGIGAGVPYCSLAGGLEGKVEASAAIGVTIQGQVRGTDPGTVSGDVSFIVDGKIGVEAVGGLYFDAVLGEDRHNLISYELGTAPIAEASVKCTAKYSNGQVVDVPPEVELELLPLEVVERQRRPLTPEERARYFPVEQGASGGSAAGAPETVEMTDAELMKAAKAQVAATLGSHWQKPVPVVSSYGVFVTVDIEGHELQGIATIPPAMQRYLDERGERPARIKSAFLSGWSLREAEALSGAKTVDAVARRLLASATIDVTALEVEPEQSGPMKPCKEEP